MPMIDVYVPDEVIPAGKDSELALALITCLVRHEGFGDPAPEYVQRISSAYVHRVPGGSVHTIAQSPAKIVRVHATFHPGGLTTESMRGFIAEATHIVTDFSGDLSLFDRIWVTLCETVEGGWGVSGKSIRDRTPQTA
jgi:hypothetical protein